MMQRRVLRSALSGLTRTGLTGFTPIMRHTVFATSTDALCMGSTNTMSRVALTRAFSTTGQGKVVILEKEADFGKITGAKGTVIVDFYAE